LDVKIGPAYSDERVMLKELSREWSNFRENLTEKSSKVIFKTHSRGLRVF